MYANLDQISKYRNGKISFVETSWIINEFRNAFFKDPSLYEPDVDNKTKRLYTRNWQSTTSV